MHKLRPLSEYKRPGGWKFVPITRDSLDLFKARMEGYKAAAAAHQVVSLKRERRA